MHVLHLLWETLVGLCLAPTLFHRKIQKKGNDGDEGTKVEGDIFTWENIRRA